MNCPPEREPHPKVWFSPQRMGVLVGLGALLRGAGARGQAGFHVGAILGPQRRRSLPIRVRRRADALPGPSIWWGVGGGWLG